MKRRIIKLVIIGYWCLCGSVLIYRIGYDLRILYFGETIVVRRTASEGYDYLLHFPRGYHDYTGQRPLLVFLHGAAEVGKDIKTIYEPYALFEEGDRLGADDFPFIVVGPVTPTGGWNTAQVCHFVEQIVEDSRFRYRIDPDRVYLTGLSMGGFGTFDTACDYPDHFAAIVPLAGGGNPDEAERLKSVPTWAFHSNEDTVVSHENSERMIRAMKEIGHEDARLTTLKGVGHDVSRSVYNRPELYRWMLSHRISGNRCGGATDLRRSP